MKPNIKLLDHTFTLKDGKYVVMDTERITLGYVFPKTGYFESKILKGTNTPIGLNFSNISAISHFLYQLKEEAQPDPNNKYPWEK